MPTHITLNGQLIPLAEVAGADALDVTDVRTLRQSGRPGNAANDFIGGAPVTDVAAQVKYYLIIRYNNGQVDQHIQYATATLRNTDRTTLITALTA